MRTASLCLFLLLLAGCSGDAPAEHTEQQRPDHVLRGQIDTMNDARAVQKIMDDRRDAQRDATAELTR